MIPKCALYRRKVYKIFKLKKSRSYYEMAFIQLEMINAWSAIVIYTIEEPLRDRHCMKEQFIQAKA